MKNHFDRISHFNGTPCEVGFEAGQKLGSRLAGIIDFYVAGMASSKDLQKLRAGALSWLYRLPDDLIGILADDEIERRGNEVVTVYSNVARPTTGELWYTFGGYPSASKGNWQQLPWPW